MSFQWTVRYDNLDNVFDDGLVVTEAYASGEFYSGEYAVSGDPDREQLVPSVASTDSVLATDVHEIKQVPETPDNGEVVYVIYIDNTPYWWCDFREEWLESNETHEQANTLDVLNAHRDELPISGRSPVRLKAFLKPGSPTPVLFSNTIDYEVSKSPSDIHETNVYCILDDIYGDMVENIEDAKLIVKTERFEHSGRVVADSEKEFHFDDSGFASVSLYETESIDLFPVKFEIHYKYNGSRKLTRFRRAQIPEMPAVNLIDVTEMKC